MTTQAQYHIGIANPNEALWSTIDQFLSTNKPFTFALRQKQKPMSLYSLAAKTCATTTTIFITTADDALWLIPFIASPSLSTTNKIINGVTFICTIQIIVLIATISACIFGSLIVGKALEFNEERCMHMIAAIITWIIAFYFYCKARCKRNKRLKKGGALLDDNVKNYQSFDDNVRDEHRENDNTSFCSSSSDSSVNYEELNIGNDVARPITVCSLTFLG